MVNNEKEICHNLLLKDQKKNPRIKGCHLKKRNFDVKIRGGERKTEKIIQKVRDNTFP